MGRWEKWLAAAAVCSGIALGIATYYAFRTPDKKRSRRNSLTSAAVDRHKNGVTDTRRIIVLGLFGAGKSSIIARFSKVDKEKRQISPTEGYNVLCIQSEGVTYNIWEIGGRVKSFWPNFIEETNLLVFVVDSTDDDSRLTEAVTELSKLLSDKRLADTPLLLLANKQDLTGAKSPGEIERLFGCRDGRIEGRRVRCLGTRAPAGSPAHSSVWETERLLLTLCHQDSS